MSTSKGKRRMPRREIPLIGNLLDRIPVSKLPTNQVVLQRLFFLLEHNNGPVAGELARVTLKNDIVSVWEYAGFGDVLKPASNIMKIMIQHHSPPEV